jgi:hypothetical protein
MERRLPMPSAMAPGPIFPAGITRHVAALQLELLSTATATRTNTTRLSPRPHHRARLRHRRRRRRPAVLRPPVHQSLASRGAVRLTLASSYMIHRPCRSLYGWADGGRPKKSSVSGVRSSSARPGASTTRSARTPTSSMPKNRVGGTTASGSGQKASSSSGSTLDEHQRVDAGGRAPAAAAAREQTSGRRRGGTGRTEL